MDIFATYATDESAELNGVWQPHMDSKFLVARAGNRKYVKALTTLVDANQKLLDAKDDTADQLSNDIMATVFADSILLGWENVSYKGQQLAYSKENAKMVLLHKDFRRVIAGLSEDIAAYRAKVEAEQVGN